LGGAWNRLACSAYLKLGPRGKGSAPGKGGEVLRCKQGRDNRMQSGVRRGKVPVYPKAENTRAGYYGRTV